MGHTPRSTEATPVRSEAPPGAVAVIASAGGIPALIDLLKLLPSDFALPIFVAQHLSRAPSLLNVVLGWHSRLPIGWASEGAQPSRGHVYLTPPGMRLGLGREGFVISALADPPSSWLASGDHLINSVVERYASRTVAVVLSGMLPSGVNGLRAVNACGGITMAQNRASAPHFEMPCAAIDFGKADVVMPPERMAIAMQLIAHQWDSAAALQ